MACLMHGDNRDTPRPDSLEAETGAYRRPNIVAEVLIASAAFFVYWLIRYATRNDFSAALANARKVVDWERGMHLFSERSLQHLVLESRAFVRLLNRYYVSVHFPITALFLVWVLLRHPVWYRSVRNWLMSLTAVAMVVHVLFPLAPPRMLPYEGFIDTLRTFGPNIYERDVSKSVANQFAAMPSLHFGWSVVVAVMVIAILRSRWRYLALLHPTMTLLAIVGTANHYWLDALVALLLVTLTGIPVLWQRRRSLEGRLTASRGADAADVDRVETPAEYSAR